MLAATLVITARTVTQSFRLPPRLLANGLRLRQALFNSAMSQPIAITSLVVEAHHKCPAKCRLVSQGESCAGNTYADWVQTQHNLHIPYRSRCENSTNQLW